jgi:hypothetical protein
MSSDFRITRYHGDTLQLPVEINDSNGANVNLTGCTIKFGLGNELLYLCSPDDGHTTAGVTISRTDASGIFTITATAAVMAAATQQGCTYNMDMQITYADGRVETLFIGSLEIVEEITA